MTSSPGSPTWRTHVLTTAVAALVLAGCSAEGSAPTGQAPDAAPQPRILFQGMGSEHLLLGVARLDGSDVRFPLEELPGGDQTNPEWSPDGTQVLLAVDDGSRDDLWIAGADGTEPRLLLDCEGACRWLDDPSWSPDGSSVVYSRSIERGRTGWGSLEQVDLTTGVVSVIVPPRSRTFAAGARWSPDGSRVVFESVHTASPGLEAEIDGVSLRIVDVASGQVGPALTDPRLFAATADWSPDGASIVYSALARAGSEASDLFVLPAAGGAPRRVTTLADRGGYAAEPTWRSDSTRIVFSGRLPGSFQDEVLLSVSADGATEPVQLRDVPLIGRHPRVEPGG
jgi:dipeptidyl aminopeptidase/acylaminoacyl peptidase